MSDGRHNDQHHYRCGDCTPGYCNESCRQSFEVLLEKTGFGLAVWQTCSSKPLADALYRLSPVAS